MYVKYEGKTESGEPVVATLELIMALRGEEPSLPGAVVGTVSASIINEEERLALGV